MLVSKLSGTHPCAGLKKSSSPLQNNSEPVQEGCCATAVMRGSNDDGYYYGDDEDHSGQGSSDDGYLDCRMFSSYLTTPKSEFSARPDASMLGLTCASLSCPGA